MSAWPQVDMEACRRTARRFGDAFEAQRLERRAARRAAGVPPESRSPLLNVKSDVAARLYATVAEAGIRPAECMPWISSVIGRGVTSSRQMTYAEAEVVTRHLREVLEEPFVSERRAS